MLLADHGERASTLAAFRALRDGASLGLIADQRPGDHESESAPFLGQPARCHQGQKFFAERGKFLLVAAFCLRRCSSDGRCHPQEASNVMIRYAFCPYCP